MMILYARCCCIRSRTLQRAIDRALEDLPSDGRIGVMPAANATIPVLDFN